MPNSTPADGLLDIVPRRLDLDSAAVSRQLARISRTRHRRGFSDKALFPDWIGYASQRHIQDMDIDFERGFIWMASWGGVLSWDPKTNQCTRYTSVHGLSGNAIDSLVVDKEGVVWVAGERNGFCSFQADTDEYWRPHADFSSVKVLCATARNEKGIYVALRYADGQCALGEVEAPNGRLQIVQSGGLATKDVECLLADDIGVWLGNAWGLHRYSANRGLISYDLHGKQVRALAAGAGDSLWVGTNTGVCRFRAETSTLSSENTWSVDAISSICADEDSDSIWIATSREIGRIVNNVWQPVRRTPPGQISKLVAAGKPTPMRAGDNADLFKEGRIWASGAGGLFTVSVDDCEETFGYDSEDELSNAVQCLSVDENAVWVGAARGLYKLDRQAQKWRAYSVDSPELVDVRAILPVGDGSRIWLGTWRGGLQRLEDGVHIPERIIDSPLVSLTPGFGRAIWGASFDEVYRYSFEDDKWQSIETPARDSIGKGIIQTLCFQSVVEIDGNKTSTLWVGTSRGLYRYRPDLGLWDWVSGDLETLSVRALVVDPSTNILWIGTNKGLFSEVNGERHLEELDIQALAVATDSTSALWVGTRTGLLRWSYSRLNEKVNGEREAHFAGNDSGLPSDTIRVIATYYHLNRHEVWVGSPWGLGCYHYKQNDPS